MRVELYGCLQGKEGGLSNLMLSLSNLKTKNRTWTSPYFYIHIYDMSNPIIRNGIISVSRVLLIVQSSRNFKMHSFTSCINMEDFDWLEGSSADEISTSTLSL